MTSTRSEALMKRRRVHIDAGDEFGIHRTLDRLESKPGLAHERLKESLVLAKGNLRESMFLILVEFRREV